MRGVTPSFLVALALVSLASCTSAPTAESAFRDFVNETPADDGSIDLRSFAEWDEARLRCGGTGRLTNGDVDVGSLVLYLDGEVILNYSSQEDGIYFCPQLRGEEFLLLYPNGLLELERSDPFAVPLDYDSVATYLSPPAD